MEMAEMIYECATTTATTTEWLRMVSAMGEWQCGGGNAKVMAMMVMVITALPIIAAYYLTRGTESIAGSSR